MGAADELEGPGRDDREPAERCERGGARALPERAQSEVDEPRYTDSEVFRIPTQTPTGRQGDLFADDPGDGLDAEGGADSGSIEPSEANGDGERSGGAAGLDASGLSHLTIPSTQAQRARAIKPRDVYAIFERQRFRCAYTGDALDVDATEGDHVIPLGRGGGHGIENIVAVKRIVNRMKGKLTLDEFVAECRKVVAIFGAAGPVILRR